MAFSFAPQLAFLAGPLEAISAGRQYPDSRRLTHGPVLSKYPRHGHRLYPHSKNGTQGLHGRDRGVLQFDCLVPESAGRLWSKVGAGHARKCTRLPLTRPKAKQIYGNCYP